MSIQSRLPLTREGEGKILAEIGYLDGIRAELAAELHDAVDKGLAEEEARRSSELAALALQISRLRDVLAWRRSVEAEGGMPVATIGCEVTVVGEDGEMAFSIVCPSNGNPRLGRVSFESPYARAVMGRSVGDEVEVALPEGRRRLRITAIQPESKRRLKRAS